MCASLERLDIIAHLFQKCKCFFEIFSKIFSNNYSIEKPPVIPADFRIFKTFISFQEHLFFFPPYSPQKYAALFP